MFVNQRTSSDRWKIIFIGPPYSIVTPVAARWPSCSAWKWQVWSAQTRPSNVLNLADPKASRKAGGDRFSTVWQHQVSTCGEQIVHPNLPTANRKCSQRLQPHQTPEPTNPPS